MKHATNATVMRASNRKLVLNLLRLSPISRVELSEKTQLTRASVTQIITELMEAGLVEELSTIESNALGRRRTLLSLRHGARFVFGININRTDCHVGAVDLFGDVFSSESFSIKEMSPEKAMEKMAEIIFRQKKELNLAPETVLGVGVCSPGPVDFVSGRIMNTLTLTKWQYVDVCARLERLTGLRVLLEKDTNALALEEKYFGSMKDVSNFILVHIGEGVGSGMISSDWLYRGARGMGTELGHTSICYNGPVCKCGNRGCLENYMRLPVLLEGTGFSAWKELTDHAGERAADEVIDRAAEYLAAPLTNVINMCDLDRVVLSGEIETNPEPLIKRLNALLQTMVLHSDDGAVVAGCKSDPVRAAAMAVLYDFFQRRVMG